MEKFEVRNVGFKIEVKDPKKWLVTFPVTNEEGEQEFMQLTIPMLPSIAYEIYYAVAKRVKHKHPLIKITPLEDRTLKIRFGKEKGFNLFLKENSPLDKAFRLFLLSQPMTIRLKLYDILKRDGSLVFFPQGEEVHDAAEVWKHLEYFGRYRKNNVSMRVLDDGAVLVRYNSITQVIPKELREFLKP